MTGLPLEKVKLRREDKSPHNFIDPHILGNTQAKGFTISSSKRVSDLKSFVPGPGQYEQKSKIVEGPQYSIYRKY